MFKERRDEVCPRRTTFCSVIGIAVADAMPSEPVEYLWSVIDSVWKDTILRLLVQEESGCQLTDFKLKPSVHAGCAKPRVCLLHNATRLAENKERPEAADKMYIYTNTIQGGVAMTSIRGRCIFKTTLGTR